MKPIYFPFTYISPGTMAALGACFKQTAVYQPSRLNQPDTMKEWESQGILDIRSPIVGDEKELDIVAKDFRTWINLRQGAELSVFKTPKDRIPYFDDGLVSQIRSSILKLDRHTPGSNNLHGKDQEVIFQKRVFLLFAQEYDIKNDEIAREIGLLEKTEQNLFSNLLWDNEPPFAENEGSNLFLKNKSEDYMVLERLYAWVYLMLFDSQESGFFVTDSPSALDYTIERAPEHETVFHCDTIPIFSPEPERSMKWAETLVTRLEKIATTDWSIFKDNPEENIEPFPIEKTGDKAASLTIYIVPGIAPDELFIRDAGCDSSKINLPEKGKLFKNTLVGLIR